MKRGQEDSGRNDENDTSGTSSKRARVELSYDSPSVAGSSSSDASLVPSASTTKLTPPEGVGASLSDSSTAPHEVKKMDFDDFPDVDEDMMAAMDDFDEERAMIAKWERPPLTPLRPNADAIVFQQLEADQYMDSIRPDMPGHGQKEQQAAVIRLWGVTDKGHSVCAHIHGFLPYFYVETPQGWTSNHAVPFMNGLNESLRKKNNRPADKYVVALDSTDGESIYGYHQDPSTFLKITMANPRQVAGARAYLETNGFANFGFPNTGGVMTYESNMDYVLRYMIDTSIVGGNWITLPAGTYKVRSDTPPTKVTFSGTKHYPPVTHCQIEVDIAYDKVISQDTEGEWSRIAPLRILSFDIECAGRKGIFPEPDVDPVIQIANVVTLQGSSSPIIRNVFTLKGCSPINGAQVLSYENEKDMLSAWREFFVKVDPDIVIGYNTSNFDFPYLYNRASHLKLEKFHELSRLKGIPCQLKDTRFSSKAYGTRESKLLTLDGRVQFDVLQVIQRDHKLRSYSLNAVSAHFLGEQKEDVHHSIITDLQNGNDETRRRLAVYCLKDALLPQRLLDKLMVVINYIEMSRVTGVPLSYLLSRGQQIKVVSQLYRKARTKKLFIPAMKSAGSSEEQYEGAIVIEPLRGFYDVPISTLDFSSLYPSIMMAHNLCYSTLLKPSGAQYLGSDKYIKTPNGDLFVKASTRKGLLPEILEELLSARKKAKKDMKTATDPFVRAVMDGRQLALKVSANSVYGFTGATVGKLPCLAISSSVTAFGRMMIDETKKRVEEQYTVANGFPADATVVYGDTDSVMVRFGVDSVAEAMKLGEEAAKMVTTHFQAPIKLEFEKVYFPYLLINKKRYAGMYWTNPDKPDKMDAKGIETVRRDNCQLVKIVLQTCLDKILKERDVAGAIDYAKSMITDLLTNKVDLSLLVITKALSKTADDYDSKQAHAELAERMRKRDAGSAPALGDRVPYVTIKGAKNAKGHEKAEDPIFVLENSIPIDTQWYLDHQLKGPLTRIFDPIMDNTNSLFQGDHTRAISISTPSVGGIMKFAVKSVTCLRCKAPIPPSKHTLCDHCKPLEAQVYQEKLADVNRLESAFAEVWTQCQRCQGSLHQDVLCTSRACPIFYMRRKVQKDLAEAHGTLARFNYEW